MATKALTQSTGESKSLNYADFREVVRKLRDRITNHELPPGSRLREQALAEQMGVPRAKIREALLALEQRGLVERIPNYGASVVKLDLEKVCQLYDVREVLEGLCTRLATENKAAKWADIAKLFDQPLERLLKDGEMKDYRSALELLRVRTLRAARNPVVENMLDSIYDQTRRISNLIIVLPGRAERGLKEHRSLLAAMCEGNGQKAELLKRQIIRHGKEALIQHQSLFF